MELGESGNCSVKLEAEAGPGRQGSLRGGRELVFHRPHFLCKAGVLRKTTFSAVAWPASSKILIPSTSVFHKTSSTNGKMNVEPQAKGTCLALCYFTL